MSMSVEQQELILKKAKEDVKELKNKKKAEANEKTTAEQIKEKTPQKRKQTKKTTEGKKIIEKSDAVKLAKQKIKDTLALIDVIPTITDEQQEQYLMAIAMGLVPDRFGLDAGLDTRLKALDQLNKIRQAKQKEATDTSDEEVVIVDDIS